jgi:MFS family permease
VFGPRTSRKRVYAGVFVVWPLTYAAITLLSSLPLTLAVLLTLGTAVGSLVPLQATIRQERAPAHLLPRIVALSTATIPVAAPAGVVATGFLIDAAGLHTTLLLLTAGATLIGARVVTSRAIRTFDRPVTRPVVARDCVPDADPVRL